MLSLLEHNVFVYLFLYQVLFSSETEDYRSNEGKLIMLHFSTDQNGKSNVKESDSDIGNNSLHIFFEECSWSFSDREEALL